MRAAFLRRYWYGDSMEDAARRLGWSVSKTKSALFRARNRLREQLKKEGFLGAGGGEGPPHRQEAVVQALVHVPGVGQQAGGVRTAPGAAHH